MSSEVISLIGKTPIVQVKRFDVGACELFLKLENQNPGGSIKDRIALSMIAGAEKRGQLKPGDTIVEATAGNTGLGLALVAALKGYKLILVIPDKMSKEKIFHLKAMGAEVLLTRSDVLKGHPEYYQDYAARIAKEKGGFYVNQFGNLDNPKTHEESTGPEIFEQMQRKVDAVVCGVGSGGTISGLSKYFAKVSPETEMVLADPVGSILTHYVNTGEVLKDSGSWMVEGIGEVFIPDIADLSRVKKAYSISDAESFEAARRLLKEEGILAGSSSGTLISAAIKYCKDQSKKKRVVTFVCDSGNKYLSKMFNDFWMADQGFLKGESFGDLRDLITRKHAEGATITIGRDDTLLTAYSRMRVYDISQLPVVEGETVVGLIDESDLLVAAFDSKGDFKKKVGEIMVDKLEKVSINTSFAELLDLFKRNLVAIVEDRGRFLGLITKVDFLNYLRRKT